MKKPLAIFISVCLIFIFSSCTSNSGDTTTNPYQVTEKVTKIKDDFNANEINKITVTIGGNETEVDKDDKLIKLLEEASKTTNTVDKELSTIVAFVKVYYNEKSVDYGVIYLDNEANAFLSSNYNQNENAVLKIDDQSLLSKLILPNMDLLNFAETD